MVCTTNHMTTCGIGVGSAVGAGVGNDVGFLVGEYVGPGVGIGVLARRSAKSVCQPNKTMTRAEGETLL